MCGAINAPLRPPLSVLYAVPVHRLPTQMVFSSFLVGDRRGHHRQRILCLLLVCTQFINALKSFARVTLLRYNILLWNDGLHTSAHLQDLAFPLSRVHVLSISFIHKKD
ncbi:hypothetical protein TRVL_08516 [Trypanosoma vivax]|nr:hypothetical protein TRVL_08516 [Trypanosoma vivax]